jgi:hypothetical protein
MKSRLFYLTTAVFICSMLYAHKEAPLSQDLKGPYFGQKPPGSQAELFAPRVITYEVQKPNICLHILPKLVASV